MRPPAARATSSPRSISPSSPPRCTSRWVVELIVFGGGVLKTPGLIEALQEAAAVRVGPAGARGSSRDFAIARTELDGEAGLYGSLLLAEQAAAG